MKTINYNNNYKDDDFFVILTGAGISAESGIKTFRDNDGLWENHRLEDVATFEAFTRQPELVHRFYNARRAQLFSGEVRANAAHHAIAKLQRHAPNRVFLVTQNVDDLHERAGSQTLHMHGELNKISCLNCKVVYQWQEDCDVTTPCQHCQQRGKLRPHIVWFGEYPLFMNDIDGALRKANYFVAIGTSGVVYPAAGFVALAKQYGAKTIEINLNQTVASSIFDGGYYGLASKEVTRWVDDVIT